MKQYIPDAVRMHGRQSRVSTARSMRNVVLSPANSLVLDIAQHRGVTIEGQVRSGQVYALISSIGRRTISSLAMPAAGKPSRVQRL